MYYSHFKYRVRKNLKENSGAKGLMKSTGMQEETITFYFKASYIFVALTSRTVGAQ